MKLRWVFMGFSLLFSSTLIAAAVTHFTGIYVFPFAGIPIISIIAFTGGMIFAAGLRRRL